MKFRAFIIVLLLGLGLASGVGRADTAPLAKVAAVQNQVEAKSGSAVAWHAATRDEALRAADHLRTGAGSRAAILYSDGTLHRLNEKSEIEILAPEAGKTGLLNVLSGQHHFTSRTPREFDRIKTPTVTAAIRGTEFVVDVAEGGTTTVTMIEGVVEASNEYGTLSVSAGEQAYVEPGKAPQRRVVVRPQDAASWALYYPSVLGGKDAERLAGLGQDGTDLARAAALLSSGQAAQARPLVDKVLKDRANDPIALALSSVLATAANDKDAAMKAAEAAAAADPSSAAAALAVSFAAQSRFDIARARAEAERAASLDPTSSVALARVAELRMSEGDLDGALKAAQDAVTRAPNEARALAVLGFVELARRRTAEAESYFERAVSADAGLPLAHTGLGIARFRSGQNDQALDELRTATVLDPEDSLARSYLGKAYYELRRSDEAGKELARAKQSDPSDPTPHLYDAIRLQNENRPIEALDELRAAIDRNGKRAVYRSRLLLDQDLAARGADLARIYNDLGFEQVGVVAARRSADLDQANYSSHLFLSGNYRALPGFANSFLSEVLQARIYQPVNVSAARPDVVSESSVSFNEYTALFDRPRTRLFAEATYGATDTDLGSLFEPGQLCLAADGSVGPCIDVVERDDSLRWSGDILGTFGGDRYSAAVGVSKSSDDGFRQNNDVEQTRYRGFFEWAPTWRDNFQVNLLGGERETGDLPLRETPAAPFPERFDTDELNVGLGWHRRTSTGNDLAVSAIYNETEQSASRPSSGTEATGTLHGPQLEVQDVLRRSNVTWVFGAGAFDGTFELDDLAGTVLEEDDTFFNGYAYAKIRDLGSVELTAGASFEKVDAPVGMLPARDSFIPPVALGFSDSKVSPKLGVSVYPTSSTVVRMMGLYRLAPFLGRVQTLEPTQVAGFNQFFDDPGGTRSLSYGLGVDQGFGSRVFVGFSLVRRDLSVPEAYCPTPDDFEGCKDRTPDRIVQRDADDEQVSVYVNAIFGKRVTGTVEYLHDESEFERTQVSTAKIFEDHVRTRRIRPEVRVLFPFGFFAVASATHFDQFVEQFDDLTSDVRFPVDSDFWTADLSIGYRLPERWGSVSLDVRNLGDREYAFFLPAVQDQVLPARSAVVRLRLTY